MAGEESTKYNPYKVLEVIRYDERFTEAVRDIPQAEVETAMNTSLMVNRLMESAQLTRVLRSFGKKHGIPEQFSHIRSDFAFIKKDARHLDVLSILGLDWPVYDERIGGRSLHQAMIAIINGKEIGGYYGAKVNGEAKAKEIYDMAMLRRASLPSIISGSVIFSNDLAHNIRSVASSTLESAYRSVWG